MYAVSLQIASGYEPRALCFATASNLESVLFLFVMLLKRSRSRQATIFKIRKEGEFDY